MLDLEKVREIAKDVASEIIGSETVEDVRSESIVDSLGADALRVLIVLRENWVDRLSGDAALDTLVRLHRRLTEQGEERFPIINYATLAELEGGNSSP